MGSKYCPEDVICKYVRNSFLDMVLMNHKRNSKVGAKGNQEVILQADQIENTREEVRMEEGLNRVSRRFLRVSRSFVKKKY